MHIVTEGPIDPFHTGMLIPLARLLIPPCDPAVRAPTHKTIGENSGHGRAESPAVTGSKSRITRSGVTIEPFDVRRLHPPYTAFHLSQVAEPMPCLG